MPSLPSLRLAELHPILVHFPIALLLTSVALDFAALFLRRWRLVDAATWCLALGVPGAAAALLSGVISERYVTLSVATAALLHWHKICAVLASGVFGVLLVLRLVLLAPWVLTTLRQSLPASAQLTVRAERTLKVILPGLYAHRLPRIAVALYLLLSLIGVALLAATGYLGGALVYDHGVGMP